LDEGGDSDDLLADIDALGGLLSSNFAAVFPMLEDLHGNLVQRRDVDGDASYNDAIAAVETLMLDNRDAYNRVTAAGLSADEALSVANAYFDGDNEGARLFDDGLLGGTGTSIGAGMSAGMGGTGAGTGGSGAGTGGTGAGTGGSGAGTGGTGAGTGGSDGVTGSAVNVPGGSDAGRGTGRGDGLAGSGVAIAGNVTSVANNAADAAGGFADPSSLNDAEKNAVLVLALAKYADALGDDSLNGLMRAEANRLLETSGLAFEELRDASEQYIPARAAADYLKLRYVWNKNLNGGALARGGEYRFYTVYSAEIITGPNSEDLDYMAFPAAYKNDEMYLPGDYAYEAFGIWAEPLPGTGYSLLVSEKISDCAAELLSRLLRTAGA
jgi:hypothetical protein